MALHENFNTPQRTSPAPAESLEVRVARLEAAVTKLSDAASAATPEPKATESPKVEAPKAPEKK